MEKLVKRENKFAIFKYNSTGNLMPEEKIWDVINQNDLFLV